MNVLAAGVSSFHVHANDNNKDNNNNYEKHLKNNKSIDAIITNIM